MEKIKTREWILLFILLAILFLFRFKYKEGTAGRYLVRINRITGVAKLYEWDYDIGKFKLHKKERVLWMFEEEE